MGMAVVHLHWRLALASGAVLCLGGVYVIAARRGRPLNERQPARRVEARGARHGAGLVRRSDEDSEPAGPGDGSTRA